MHVILLASLGFLPVLAKNGHRYPVCRDIGSFWLVTSLQIFDKPLDILCCHFQAAYYRAFGFSPDIKFIVTEFDFLWLTVKDCLLYRESVQAVVGKINFVAVPVNGIIAGYRG